MSEEEPRLVLEIDLINRGAQKFVINSPQELRNWVQTERTRWEWLNQFGLFESYQNADAQAQNRARDWENSLASPGNVVGIIRTVKAELGGAYEGEGPLIHSESLDGVFIHDLRSKKGPAVAAGAHFFLRRDRGALSSAVGNRFRPEMVEGILDAILFRREIDFTGQVHRAGLEEIRAQYQRAYLELQEKAAELEKRNAELNGQFEQVLHANEAALTKLHTDQGGQFGGLMEQSAKSLGAIEQTYNQKLALQAPVQYWKEVADRHRKIAGRFTVILLVCGGVFAWVMYTVLHWALQGVATKDAPQHWQLGVIVTTAFLGIWTLRVLLRFVMSNVHLATDAEERKTMILTYLSLVREGVDVQPDDKTLILQHIFRSASDGIVKDDAAPPGIFELLTRGK